MIVGLLIRPRFSGNFVGKFLGKFAQNFVTKFPFLGKFLGKFLGNFGQNFVAKFLFIEVREEVPGEFRPEFRGEVFICRVTEFPFVRSS